MRLALFITACCAALCLSACSSTGSDSGLGLSQTFDPSNYRRADNTNGTQTRPDVNRQFTQPPLPSIINRGN